MKKYITRGLLATFIITLVFISGSFTAIVKAETMTISQLVELLISIGAISSDKVITAREAVSKFTLATTTVATVATTTSSVPYIQVLVPNGGQSWELDLDVPYIITWGSIGLSQVNVALVSANTKIPVCNLTSTPIATINGNNSYSVRLKTALCFDSKTASSTPIRDGVYKARVFYTVNGKLIQDDSDTTFKVLPVPIPSLKVTYPNGGESLLRNHDYVVKYSLTNIDKSNDGLIYLNLYDNAGNSVFNSHKLLRSDKTYDLELPSNLTTGAYQIKLTLTTKDKVVLEDSSDKSFWISSGL